MTVFAAVSILALFAFAAAHVKGPWLILPCFFALLLVGYGLARAFDGSLDRAGKFLAEFATLRTLAMLFSIGVLLRLIPFYGYEIAFTSDGLVYWQLAERLIQGQAYEIGGTLSYWPPGMPAFLAAMRSLFGESQAIVLLANLGLLAVTMLLVHGLGKLWSLPGVAFAACCWITLSPNLIMLAPFAVKELLVMPLILLAIVGYASAARASHRQLIGRALLVGLPFGAIALTQPAMSLLLFFFIAYDLLTNDFKRRAVVFASMVVLSATTVIAPWALRNYALHDTFVPLTTASGVNLLSANNPEATGGWMEMDYDSYLEDEIAGNRRAMAEAVSWIVGNPADFLALSFKKVVRLLGRERQGGINLFEKVGDDERFRAALILAEGAWLLLLIACSISAFSHLRSRRSTAPSMPFLLLPILYAIAIFAIFQSEDRHHINIFACFALLASLRFATSRSTDETV